MKLNIIFGHCNRSNYCLQMYINHLVKYLKIQPTKNNYRIKCSYKWNLSAEFTGFLKEFYKNCWLCFTSHITLSSQFPTYLWLMPFCG